MKLNRDWRLHVIVGQEAGTLETAEAALQGGARTLQYRGKDKSGSVQLQEASTLRSLTWHYGAHLVVNDRVDIALLADADGLHLGENDMPLSAARRILGPEKIIGATAHSMCEAEQAEQDCADYIGFGAIFETPSKNGVPVLGLETLRQVVQGVSVPVIAIGGITAENLPDVFRSGAAGIAVLSAVSGSGKPQKAVGELLGQMPS